MFCDVQNITLCKFNYGEEKHLKAGIYVPNCNIGSLRCHDSNSNPVFKLKYKYLNTTSKLESYI